MRRSELIRALQRVPDFPHPDPALEQVLTPSEAAAEMLLEAHRRGDLENRAVTDLGSGTGRLSVGAALLGGRPVRGIEISPEAVALARRCAQELGCTVEFTVGELPGGEKALGTIVMNPPFGAQKRGADRPFWEAAFSVSGRAVYAFALAESRTFIEREVVERGARIEAIRPVPWELPRTFAHHRRRSVSLEVDLWVLRTAPHEP
ncbi:MAG: METTL5 family protein [Thermoplasmata archaeon]|nr:METTL5 family protein [Thermoplasmata archaeon]